MMLNYSRFGFGKYGGLSVSVIFLVILIVSLLSLNLFLSNLIEKNSATVSVVGRQSSLINQISKDLFLINARYESDLPVDQEQIDLGVAIGDFDSVLNALTYGGVVSSGDGVSGAEIVIGQFRGINANVVLSESQTIWKWYKESISPVFSKRKITGENIINAREVSEKYTKRLSFLMDLVASRVQKESSQILSRLRLLQYFGIILTVCMLVWTIFVTLKNLRKSDRALERSRQETSGILRTVREGLFLLDEDLLVGNQCSDEMKQIFNFDNIGGMRFASLLERIVPSDKSETVQNFVKLLFNSDVVEDLIGSLNPLDNIEVKLKDANGNSIVKHLDFSFFRVMSSVNNDKIENILVSVRDMTDQFLLKKELEGSKIEGSNRMVMLDEFLRADSDLVSRFIVNARKSLSNINMLLKNDAVDIKGFKSVLGKVFVEIHRLKGESTALGFSHFSERAHDFESELDRLKKIHRVQGINFLPLTIKLEDLMKSSEDIIKISNSISKRIDKNPIDSINTKDILKNSIAEWAHLPALVKTTSDQYGKSVNSVMTGFVESNLTKEYKSLISNLSIQLIKNSIIHGIENQNIRVAKNKPPQGRIDLTLMKLPNGSIELVMKDDGHGFDVEKIRKKMINENIISLAEANMWSRDKLIRKAFATGFSTAEQVDINAGRGIGLNVIRDSIAEVGGKISLRQVDDKYCQFNILLPAKMI